MFEEDEIVIIEKRFVFFWLVEIIVEEIFDEVWDKGFVKKVVKLVELIVEFEVVFEEKIIFVFELDILVEVRNGEEEFKDDENVIVEFLFENLEFGFDYLLLELVVELFYEIKDEILEEVFVVLERRFILLWIE